MPQVVDIAPDNANTHAILRAAAAEIIRLKGERKAVNEEITACRAKVKALGVRQIDFNVAIRLHELAAEDRSESLANLRACFAALDIGQQGDLFPAPPVPDFAGIDLN